MGISFVVTGFFLVGMAALAGVLLFFVNGRRYGGLSGPLSPVEFALARREVERRVFRLAPRMLLLEEKRRTVEEILGQGAFSGGALSGELRGRFETLVRGAPMAGAWRRFSAALALAETRPLEALGELEEVSWMVETTISKLVKAEELCEIGERV